MAGLPERGRPVTQLNMERLEDRTTPVTDFMDGRVLIGLTSGVEQSALAFVNSSSLVSSTKHLGFGVYEVDLKPGVTVSQAISAFNGRNGVRYAQPDYKVKPTATPNDPSFQDGTLWAHNNTGQNGGTAGADSRSVPGWDFGTGTGKHIVAIIDQAVDYNHPDLAANMWTNPGEVPGDGIDNDGNGVIDDVHGYDFTRDSGDLLGGIVGEHGTHVAGIVGAVGNNGIGVVGSVWKTQMMSVPIFSTGANSATMSAIVQALNYAVQMGASILNNSWGGANPTSAVPALEQAIRGVAAKGAIFVAAAGNDAVDNDVNGYTPTNFYGLIDNMVSVAAFDRNDQLASFSQWGRTKVTLGAPGVEIYSTVLNNGYGYLDGTSMACPQVTGALTAFWDANPDFTYTEVIDALKRSVRQIPAAAGKVDTGGVLDLAGLMAEGKLPQYATGAGVGGGPLVHVYRGASGRPAASFFAYDASFTGGVRVATADVNGDGLTDIIAVPGKGGGPNIRVFDGKTHQIVYDFQAFESDFTGGLFVAARDMDNDGWAEIIVAADSGGGPRIKVFKPNPLKDGVIEQLADFFAYDAGFTGGVRIALGDVDGDGYADLLTAPGVGGGPHVKVFSGAEFKTGSVVPIKDLMAGNPENLNGLFITAGDFNADGYSDIVVGSGAQTPVVRIYDGRSLNLLRQIAARGGPVPGLVVDQDTNLEGTSVNPGFPLSLIPPAIPFNQLPVVNGGQTPLQLNGYQYGIRVATHDVNKDGVADLLLAAGPTDKPTVSIINGATFAEMRNFQTFEDFFYGGVFIGGAGDPPISG